MDKPASPKTQATFLCHAIEAGDVKGVRELLAAGAPTEHPQLRASALMVALHKADAEIIDALLDAGAKMANAAFYIAMKPALKAGNLRVLEHALKEGAVSESDFSGILFDAIADGQEDLALRMLELGVNPMSTRWDNTIKRRATAFESAVLWSHQPLLGRDASMPRLIAAMLARLTPKHKDMLLASVVAAGSEAAARILLDAGADAHQTDHRGRTLLHIADDLGDDAVGRLLRSAITKDSIEAAMPEDDTGPAAPSCGSFTL